MTTTPELPSCKTAQLFRWILTGHQGARSNIASTLILGRQSLPMQFSDKLFPLRRDVSAA
jgi:hypothetical protein